MTTTKGGGGGGAENEKGTTKKGPPKKGSGNNTTRDPQNLKAKRSFRLAFAWGFQFGGLGVCLFAFGG